jgi:hypothetical protein
VLLRSLAASLAATTLVLVALCGCSAAGGGAVVLRAGAPNPPTGGSALVGAGDLGPNDGYIPDGESVALTDDVPAVTRLDAGLREALANAAEAAAKRDVQITLVDGWRSARYQRYLFERAVEKYGSSDEAARWVKGPDASKHVQGEAVDIATADAMDWLNRFGGEYGLCQIYANEAWHFELAADDSGTCPAPLTDASAG